jgi:hypothetical protein
MTLMLKGYGNLMKMSGSRRQGKKQQQGGWKV